MALGEQTILTLDEDAFARDLFGSELSADADSAGAGPDAAGSAGATDEDRRRRSRAGTAEALARALIPFAVQFCMRSTLGFRLDLRHLSVSGPSKLARALDGAARAVARVGPPGMAGLVFGGAFGALLAAPRALDPRLRLLGRAYRGCARAIAIFATWVLVCICASDALPQFFFNLLVV